ncbi:type II secretion system minor pseudopilin GspI [Aestuariicella hydrocarbonica]|uniref:Type II secretion system protein I n=1 Tax=Pseudomaricurvus hydrocarbonicus TaxID=1470433 RepID=A0A9E5JS25_9GAMM|nr:type II secretion system minor pseudopilin GspI [Aestuariicella hydrocarbonica]NHO65772.1 type II secretion system minor pseudopilin GspI [Aestuariicella hydrocarbonica]
MSQNKKNAQRLISRRLELSVARGFSLLEVLVAFAILTLTLAVVMQVFSQVVSNTARVESRRLALMMAESQLNYMVANDMESGRYQGEFDNGYRWQADVEAMRPLDDEATDTPAWEEDMQFLSPHLIRLEVSWGEARQLTLQRVYLRELP